MIRRRFKPKGRDRLGVQGFTAHGEKFRSKLEFAVRNLLKLRERAGELKILNREDHVLLGPAKFRYIPDFKCLDLKTNEEFWVEAKGYETDTWKRNKRLWKFHGPGKLEIWVGPHQRPRLKETVVPAPHTCPACGQPLAASK